MAATHGVEVLDPDTYLCRLLDDMPDEMTATLERLAGEKRRPPRTPLDLLDALAGAGVPSFAERMRVLLATDEAEERR